MQDSFNNKQQSKSASAKAFILDLLRMTKHQHLPVSVLVGTAELVGLNGNAIRVNLNRMLSRKEVHLDERGLYSLGSKVEKLISWLDQWEQGENRVKAWDGAWLILTASKSMKIQAMVGLGKTAANFGFREVQAGTWTRPNNLKLTASDIASQIAAISMNDDFFISQALSLVSPKFEFNPSQLWDRESLDHGYRHALAIISEGIKNAPNLNAEEKFSTSYFLGAEVNHLLAIDPLLPEELVDVNLRQQVNHLFVEYYQHYIPAWLEVFKKSNRHSDIVLLEKQTL